MSDMRAYRAESGTYSIPAGLGRRLLRGFVRGATAGVCAALAAGPAAGDGARPVRILALGDSVTAGLGLRRDATYPPLLAAELHARGFTIEVINAGVSGDTTAGGLARLKWSLADKPDIVIVALGGNDGLRGIEPAETHRNLDGIVAALVRADVTVLLAGMYAPPNLGTEYEAEFNRVFPAVAKARGVALYPFLLDGVALDPELNQADGIHPNGAGLRVIAQRLARALVPLIEARTKRAP